MTAIKRSVITIGLIVSLISLPLITLAKTQTESNKANSQNTVIKTTADNKSVWDTLWGKQTPNAFYLGMETYHFSEESRKDDRWNNNLIAGSYHSYFFGTLKNSFDDRAFVVGIERLWDTQHVSENTKNEVGYRLGLISGYDERMTNLANYTPVLPFPQVFDNIMWKNFGIELSWCVVTLSAGLIYQFN